MRLVLVFSVFMGPIIVGGYVLAGNTGLGMALIGCGLVTGFVSPVLIAMEKDL